MEPVYTLNQWLSHISSLHHVAIDFTLERIRDVAQKMQLLHWDCPVITVTGTNGKGSCIAAMESIIQAAGYRTGCFCSPALFSVNDQIHLNGHIITEAQLCQAYAKIEQARGQIPLTLFEFTTLAALYLFKQAELDLILLEVGMGGRDDAVNIVDCDIAIITTVDLDHQAWLGNDIDSIATHKAGIMRDNKPVICGDSVPRPIIVQQAQQLNAPLYRLGHEFSFHRVNDSWHFSLNNICKYSQLPYSHLNIENMAIALMAVTLLEDKMSITKQAVYAGIDSADLPGRFQVIDDEHGIAIFDVAHNPQSCEHLLKKVQCHFPGYQIRAVVGMLKDKDIEKSLKPFIKFVDKWHITSLQVERGASNEKLQKILTKLDAQEIECYQNVHDAFAEAREECEDKELVLVFGSFITVAEALNVNKRLVMA